MIKLDLLFKSKGKKCTWNTSKGVELKRENKPIDPPGPSVAVKFQPQH